MAKFLMYFHLGMMGFWVLIAIPGITIWKDSILFVIILSLMANLIGQFAAYQGARGEVESKK